MKKWISIALVVIMLFSTAGTGALAFEKKYSVKSTEINYELVKARLTSLGSTLKEVNIKLNGQYYLKESNKKLSDCMLTVKLADSTISLYKGDTILALGTELNICRCNQIKEAGYITIGDRQYLGDFRFRYDKNSDGELYLQVINHVPMAYYLYGVLAGEMGNSTELEALKSQAIAAKCYCIKSMKAGSNYDIGDTSATQVYKGYSSTWNNIFNAVDSTIGKVVTYDGKIHKTYYASSNGGETDLPTNAWGGAASLNNGFSMTIDNYDFNSTGIRETLTVKTNVDASENNADLLGMLLIYAQKATDSQIKSLKTITYCEMNTPKNEGSLRNMTNAYFEVSAQVDKTGQGGNADEIEELSFNIPVAEFMNYGVFTKTVLRTYWGQAIDDNTYEIYHARYGHGVGLSQRAAKYRAAQGQTYKEILGFYFPGTEISDEDISMPVNKYVGPAESTPNPKNLTVADADLSQTVITYSVPQRKNSDEFYSAKPPVLIIDKDSESLSGTVVESYAYVTNAGAKLRSSASDSGIVINMLDYGDILTVLKTDKKWLSVQTQGNMTGYIASEDVKTLEKSNGDTFNYMLGYTNAASVNFRSAPSTSSSSYGKLPEHSTLYIWGTAGTDNSWYYVQYGLTYGYVYFDYVQLSGTYSSVSVASGSIVASGITKSSVNLRPEPNTQNTPISTFDGGTYLLIYSYQNGWYSVQVNGLRGYMSDDYVTVNSSVPISPKNIENPVSPQIMGTGTINAQDVRFRSAPSTSSSIIATLKKGTTVTLYALENNWYYAKYDSKMGYIYAQYVDATEYPDSIDIDEDDLKLAVGQATGNVNFRKAATTSSDKLDVVAKSDKFDVIGTCGDWYFIYYKGKYGFVSGKYSTVIENGNVGLIAVSSSWEVYSTKTADEVNLRRGASIQHSVIEKLSKNTTVTVLAITGGWCLVNCNGVLGFVSHDYLVK